jgi:nitroreductase
MEFLELAQKRFSVRKFEDKPIEEEKLQKILEAGRVAPTAKNQQPTKIYVLKSEEALAKIRAITPATFNAPVVLLVCTDEAAAWVNPFDDFNSTVMDTSIIGTHMMMEAEDLGLGTTWVCWFDTAKVKEEFNIPDGIQPRCLFPIGYPAADVKPGPMHPTRKALEEYVTVL